MNEYLYQPVIKKADGSTALPEGFYSFMAFRHVNNLRKWMKYRGHKRTNYEVKQYKQDEIEDPTVVDDEIQDTLTIRLKRQKTFHFVEWYDGVECTPTRRATRTTTSPFPTQSSPKGRTAS